MQSIRLNQVENSARRGVELAQAVLRLLDSTYCVTVDAAVATRLTPSFANAFVMTLRETLSVSDLQSRVQIDGASNRVASAINQSALRYSNGVRLSGDITAA